MATSTVTRPVILIATAPQRLVAGALGENPYAVVEVYSGALALQWAPDLQPDTIILDADLPDIPGVEVCRLLHTDHRIGHSVPIVIVAADQPTPEQRVNALRAGAWDFLRHPRRPDDLALTLHTYVQAKRNIDLALAEGMVDPATGLHTRYALARRARELGALMARQRGALACVVFAIESATADPTAASFVARSARLCDVVGLLGPSEFAVLAPSTDHAGAVKLAERYVTELRGPKGGGDILPAGTAVRAGYDAVANLTYSPIDPAALLTRAAAAVQYGSPDTRLPWVRRFIPRTAPAPRATPPGLELDKRSVTS